MLKITETKLLLMQYFWACNHSKHHKFKHIADDYEIPRRQAYRAYDLGHKIADKNRYLERVYNENN